MKECMRTAPGRKNNRKEIVGTCGLTRQTFYRNFQDKYDLINWYFDKILLESFEHMGEGRTVYESLVNKFEYIQMEQLFFRAAFKNDQQNCLRDHDFELIQEFYTKQIESRTGRIFPLNWSRTGNAWFGLYDGAVGARVSEMYARRAGTCADRIHACAAEGSISKTGINIERKL